MAFRFDERLVAEYADVIERHLLGVLSRGLPIWRRELWLSMDVITRGNYEN
jgi:hypothetical protein